MAGTHLSPLLADRGVTRRESEVLAELAERVTNAEIATRLYVSERTVESHVASLLRKLGARNRVELGDLARDLRARERPHRSSLPAPLAMLTESGPFVGRAAELGWLRKLWRSAADGRILIGVVGGGAGMGKSRLVAELAVAVHAEGAVVLWGACFEDVRAPYHPFVQAISADLATASDAEVERRWAGSGRPIGWLLPELGADDSPPPGATIDPVSAQVEMFAALHTYFVRAAEKAPVLLVVEDLQWATATTRGLLRYLARMSGTAPVLIVTTVRDERPDADEELSAFLADLAMLRSVDRMHLGGLGEADVGALVARLDRTLDGAAAWATTGGNPLFVHGLAGMARGDARSLRALLVRRYTLLGELDLTVLDHAAVVGVDFDADLVTRAVRYPRPVVLESLERAEKLGVIARVPDRPGHFQFAHALFRTVRIDDMAPDHLGALHAAIAGAMRGQAGDAPDLTDLARHASMAMAAGEGSDAGEDPLGTTALAEPARRALRDSAERAWALNDFEAAVHDYEGALRLWPVDDPDRPALLLGLGRALSTARRGGTDILTEARDGLLARGDVEGAAEALALLGDLAWARSQWDTAAAQVDDAEALIDDRPPSAQVARVLADVARIRLISGADRAARTSADRALAIARDLGLRALEAHTLITRGTARVGEGDLGGLNDARAGVRIAEELDSMEAARGYGNLSYIHAILGELHRADIWRRRAAAVANRFGLAEPQRWSQAHGTEYQWHIGAWDEALAGAEAFIGEFEGESNYLVTVCLRVRARVRMGRGNATGGLADSAAGLEFARGARNPSNLLVALPFHARCLYEAGRLADAGAAVTEALHAAGGTEYLLDPIETAIVLFGLGRGSELHDVAARASLASPRLDAGRLIADGHLDRAADRLAELGYRSTEAYVRLMAAERAIDGGHPCMAEAQVRRALAFHRSVNATAYVDRGVRVAAQLR